MDLGLRNKTALVLGGGGGLGRAIALSLAHEGANVVLADVDETALKRAAQEVEAAGARTLSLQWDLGDLAAIERHVATIEAEFGGVDVLVNNTGGPPPTPASGQPAEAWQKYFGSMVLSVIAITDACCPACVPANGGA